MTIRIDTPVRTCLWRLDGRCFRRMKHRCAGANGNCPSPGLGKPPTILDLLDFIRGKHSIDELPKCDEVPGSPCPHLPIFDGRVLSFRGEVLLEYERWCRQAELLAAFQLQGWIDFIEDPLASHDAENGLSDLVLEMNRNQRIHFSCHDRIVHWGFGGDEAARAVAPRPKRLHRNDDRPRGRQDD